MKIRNYLLIMLLACLVFFSCNKEETTVIKNDKINSIPNDGTVLGKKLENPYTVQNMKTAYNNLKNSDARIENIEIKANYLYVRFLPKDKKEYDRLRYDETIELYDIPLDREIAKEGANYRDPTLPEDYPYTWYYCAVPVGFNFPSKYEILAELFIPVDDLNLSLDEKKSNGRYSEAFSETLVDEAMRITGNLTTPKSSNVRTQRYNPHGTIRVWDDVMSDFIAVHGAKVRARRWFESREGLTDEWGGFWISESFKEDVNFSILWERDNFDIKDNAAQALYNGPKQRGAWNLDIHGGKSQFFATIHRAAHDYYYNNPFPGLGTPPVNNTLFDGRLSYSAKYWDETEDVADYRENRGNYGWAEIRIFRPGRRTENIYSTSIHETSHAHHRAISQWHFNNCDRNLAESWSRYIQWMFANDEYRNLTGNPNYNYAGDWNKGAGFQNYNPSEGAYTPFFIDLFDNFNQIHPLTDHVSGYDYMQFKAALGVSTTIREAANHLIDNYDNPTENTLTSYVNQY